VAWLVLRDSRQENPFNLVSAVETVSYNLTSSQSSLSYQQNIPLGSCFIMLVVEVGVINSEGFCVESEFRSGTGRIVAGPTVANQIIVCIPSLA
jgi:hypothetical protein